MILPARPSFLRSRFSESRDLVAARVAVRTLLSRLEATSQSLRNEIANRVVQEIGRGAEEIPEDVKDLHAEAACLDSLHRSASEHLDHIDQFAKMLSGDDETGAPGKFTAFVPSQSRMLDERRAPLMLIESAGIFAYGCHTAAGFNVGKGSLYRKDATQSLFRAYREERAEIEKAGVVCKTPGGQWAFQQDHLFRAPGVAAMVTFGVAKSANAWVEATGSRILALMARHGIEGNPEGLAQFSMVDPSAPQEKHAGDALQEELSLRSRQLRAYALQSFGAGGRDLGEGRWENETARLLHITRDGQSPWKFQIRRDALEWVLSSNDNIQTRSIILICGERGFVPIRARDIQDLIAGQWAKGATGKAYAVIGVRSQRADQMEIFLAGTSRSLRNPVTLRE